VAGTSPDLHMYSSAGLIEKEPDCSSGLTTHRIRLCCVVMCTTTHTEPAGGASRILRQASSSPYQHASSVGSPPVFAFGRGGGDSELGSGEPPSIMGGSSVGPVLTPSMLAAAAAATSSTEAGGYDGEQEDEEEGEITDATPFLKEQRSGGWRRVLPQRCVGRGEGESVMGGRLSLDALTNLSHSRTHTHTHTHTHTIARCAMRQQRPVQRLGHGERRVGRPRRVSE
jgi:hypothetical protein